MKRILFAALAVCVLASCGKDNNGTDAPEPGKQATLTVTVASPDKTRAVGTAPTGDDALTNLSLFIVDNLGTTAWTFQP